MYGFEVDRCWFFVSLCRCLAGRNLAGRKVAEKDGGTAESYSEQVMILITSEIDLYK